MAYAKDLIKEWFKSNPGIHSNQEIASSIGYHNSKVSTVCVDLYADGLLARHGKGVWEWEKGTVDSDHPTVTKALDAAKDDKTYFDIRVSSSSKAPGDYTYHRIATRDGRTGILVWDE
jgi:hypothetical protein